MLAVFEPALQLAPTVPHPDQVKVNASIDNDFHQPGTPASPVQFHPAINVMFGEPQIMLAVAVWLVEMEQIDMASTAHDVNHPFYSVRADVADRNKLRRRTSPDHVQQTERKLRLRQSAVVVERVQFTI